MKIKRFVAKDIRLAMRMVKDELGADAVIMSNRSVDEGVEIVAARDFDEQVIHNKLNSQPEPSYALKKENTKVELLDFEVEKDKLHIVSSPRKMGGNVGVTSKRPVNKNINQYLGYTEKASLPEGKRPVEKKRIQKKLVQKNSESPLLHQESPRTPAKNPEKQVTNEKVAVSNQLMQEMHDEIKSLKAVFNSKLAEISFNQSGQNNSLRVDLLNLLVDKGFSKKLSTKMANRFENYKNLDHAFEKAQGTLAQVLPIADDTFMDQGGIFALVGPTGVGKTTTVAKLAANYILKHGSSGVALITVDNYRIVAHEQLNTYGKLLDVPVKTAATAKELREHLLSFRHKKLVLIDTAGMSQRDLRLSDQIDILKQENIPVKAYLVMSASTQYSAINETVKTYKVFGPESCILTKLDETVTLGSSISSIIEHQLPISFMTNGQQVPEDIYFPDAMTLIEQCVTGIDEETDYTNENKYTEGYA